MQHKQPRHPGVEWDHASRPAHLVNRATRLFARVGDSRLQSLGVTSGQIPVLAMLKDGAALAQKELATRARIEQPSMAQTLARMERDGLIERRRDPADKRSTLIHLSAQAASRLPAVREVLLSSNSEALRGFSREEAATLANLLQRLIANLEAMADREHPAA